MKLYAGNECPATCMSGAGPEKKTKCDTINKTKDECQAPQGAQCAIAKQLLVTDDEVSHHNEEKD